MFKLVIADDEGKTTSVPLVRDEITIGRKEGNTIRLTERNVSRRHARLQKQSGQYLLHDLGSYNGTLLNGSRINEAKTLKNGDQILIGDYKLAIVEEGAAAPAPSGAGGSSGSPGGAGGPPGAGFSQGAVIGSPGAMSPALLNAATQPDLPAYGAAPAPVEVPTPTQAPYRNGALGANGAAGSDVPESVRGVRLVFIAPAGVPGPMVIERLPLVLGRSEASDISLPFSSISREHARIFAEDDELFIEDLGSSNGVLLNGNRVRKGRLTPGDLITLGVVEARLARRGDETIVMATDIPGLERRSPVPLVLAAVGVLALIGGVAAMLLGGNRSNDGARSDASASASALAASAMASASAAAASARASAVVIPAPTVVAVQPTVVPTAVPEVTAAVPTAEPTVADVAPTAAAISAPTGEPAVPTPRVRPTANTPDRSARVTAPPPPLPVSTASMLRVDPPRATATPTAAPPHVATHSAAPPHASSAPAGSGLAPMDEARACLRSGDNQCVIDALRTRASTEQELALLATTYRSMGNRAEASRVMNRYLNRFPDGPRAENFRSYVSP